MEENQTQNEVTNTDILEAIQIFSQSVDKQFEGVKGEITGVKGELKISENQMVAGFSSLRVEIASVKSELLEKIERLEKTDKEDTDACVHDCVKLQKRVEKLEQQISRLQPAT